MTTAVETPVVTRHAMPNGDVVHYKDSDHSYWEQHNGDGRFSGRVSGVSTIAKSGDGDGSVDGLMDWAARLTCEGVAREASLGLGQDTAADIAHSLQWLASGDSVGDMLKEQKLRWRDLRDEAGVRGSVSHDVLQSLAEDVVPELQTGYDEAVVNWWKTRRPEPIYVERVVYDSDRKFAGRFDLLYGDSEPVLLDLKTSKGLRNAFVVQLNLYALAMRTAGFTVPKSLAILHVKEDGTWAEVQVPIEPSWATDAINVYRNGQKMRSALRANLKHARTA